MIIAKSHHLAGVKALQTLERSSKAEGGRTLGPILKSILE
jgi:hypothetical protein